MTKTCIIIGAGHAAAQLGPALRQAGWDGRIIIVGDEPHIPYHRPPLSKEFLAGTKKLEDIFIRPTAVYEKAGIEFLLGDRVQTIDRGKKRITLSRGETLEYDRLALTLGARARRVDLPGMLLNGVHYLRAVADVELIRADIKAGSDAVIVGGGYIGLETAAVLRGGGMNVTIVEMMDRVMQRVTTPVVSAFYERVHREQGVKLLCNAGVTGFEGGNRIEHVVLKDGTRLPAQLVIVGVGNLPNVELAHAAGLKIENGIVVDEYARTSDAHIVAAGDCTWHHNPIYDRWMRLESVQNATEQARIAAATICGKEERYSALPWFWSDQYDLKLQIAGLSAGHDEVIMRGDTTSGRSFAAFYLKQGRVIAVDAVNKAPEFMAGKKLITDRKMVDKPKLGDTSVPIRDQSK